MRTPIVFADVRHVELKGKVRPMIVVPTVRIWVYLNRGMVRLTLKPSEQITHTKGGPTDEGWERDYWIFTHEGDHITFTHVSDGADCDGRLSNESTFICSIWEAMNPTPGSVPTRFGRTEEVPFIRWKEIHSARRDYQAEQAGY